MWSTHESNKWYELTKSSEISGHNALTRIKRFQQKSKTSPGVHGGFLKSKTNNIIHLEQWRRAKDFYLQK